MLVFKHRTLIVLAGLVWFVIGVFLLHLGLRLLTGLLLPEAAFSSMFAHLSSMLGSYEHGVIALILIGLIVGFYKGRFVLAKSVSRFVKRIRSFEEPTSIVKMYSFPYFMLILSMIGLGMSIKYFQVPSDIRGAIDVAIGAALINGAMIYFRQARTLEATRDDN